MLKMIARVLLNFIGSRLVGMVRISLVAGLATWLLSSHASSLTDLIPSELRSFVHTAQRLASSHSGEMGQPAGPAPVKSSSISGRVVGISDGDTLTLLEGRTQHKVRLAEIDAPDRCQPFYEVSRRALSNTCFNRQASLQIVDRDRYGRIVAKVQCDGIDANATQLRLGMAWVYSKYSKGNREYDSLQATARSARVGIWQETSPIPPWDWRTAGRHQGACK